MLHTKFRENRRAGVTVYLDPLGSLTPGGQATPGYLDPHPGYLDPHHFFLLKPIKIQNII